jgi:ribosomal RNA assembly protein
LTISLPDDRKRLKRVTSRLIGTRGKARRNLERLTQTHISVFGKTVSIIGKYEDAERAGHAIEKLIDGFSHRSVYEFLEKR